MGFQPPLIGSWYRDKNLGTLFEVIALDEHSCTIDVQYVDGAIDEFDFESWQQISIARAAAPEDGTVAYELSPEDRLSENSALFPESCSNPVTFLEPESFSASDDY